MIVTTTLASKMGITIGKNKQGKNRTCVKGNLYKTFPIHGRLVFGSSLFTEREITDKITNMVTKTGYGCRLLLDKDTHTGTINMLKGVIELFNEAGDSDYEVIEKGNPDNVFMADGDNEKAFDTTHENTKNQYTVNVSNKGKYGGIKLLDENGSPATEEVLYDGCHVIAFVSVYEYDNQKRGLSMTVEGVRFHKHGEKLLQQGITVDSMMVDVDVVEGDTWLEFDKMLEGV